MITEYLKILNTIRLLSDNGREPLCDFDSNGKITVIRVTQSLIKFHLWKGEERPDTCPRKTLEAYLKMTAPEIKSDAQDGGVYFETKSIGGGAHGKVTDLPRNKRTGKRTTRHERIDEAVERFKLVAKETGMVISDKNTQVKRSVPYAEHDYDVEVFLEGTADIISPFKYKNIEYNPACIDLKLCGDVSNTFQDKKNPWFYYPWGDPSRIDHIQGRFYSILFELPFLNLVFDYKKEDPSWKPVPVQTITSHPDSTEAKMRYRETIQDIKWMITKIMSWQEDGFKEDPTEESCSKCPVEDCKVKLEIEHI